MDNGRYQFTNWTEEPFEGRFGGQPYNFLPGETKEYDPDKHYMLIVMSKQLADRELAKNVKGVLRTKEAGNDYGKAIDANGNLYKPTVEERKEMMRKAIGYLADKSIPYPETQEEEAGATKQTTENITELQEQVQSLTAQMKAQTEMIQSFLKTIGEQKTASTPSTEPESAPQVTQLVSEATSTMDSSNVGMTRDVLIEMAKDAGITVPEGASKDQIIALLTPAGQTPAEV